MNSKMTVSNSDMTIPNQQTERKPSLVIWLLWKIFSNLTIRCENGSFYWKLFIMKIIEMQIDFYLIWFYTKYKIHVGIACVLPKNILQ